jgi:hypothetical protein
MGGSQYHSGQMVKREVPTTVTNQTLVKQPIAYSLFWLLQVNQYYDDGGLNSKKKKTNISIYGNEQG